MGKGWGSTNPDCNLPLHSALWPCAEKGVPSSQRQPGPVSHLAEEEADAGAEILAQGPLGWWQGWLSPSASLLGTASVCSGRPPFSLPLSTYCVSGTAVREVVLCGRGH